MAPEELIKEYEKYAAENGFKLNSDKQAVERIIKGLLEREEKFGFRFCPCRRVTNKPEEDQKIICPCVYHKAEIGKGGRCLCGLFMK